MSDKYTGIHSAVILVRTPEMDHPVRISGWSYWSDPPTLEQYTNSMLESVIQDGLSGVPEADTTRDKIRVVEMNFSIIEPDPEITLVDLTKHKEDDQA